MGIDDILETEHGFVLNEAIDYEIYTEKSGNLLKNLIKFKKLIPEVETNSIGTLFRILGILRELRNYPKFESKLPSFI